MQPQIFLKGSFKHPLCQQKSHVPDWKMWCFVCYIIFQQYCR